MVHRSLRIGFLSVFTSALVAGCGPEMGVPVTRAPAEEPSQSPPPSPPPVNRAPSVSGTPSSTVASGNDYRFTPTAADADGDALVWSISGKPVDATFSAATGTLSWTPGEAGTWPNIRISVTDDNGASASLPAFSIVVSSAAQTGSAALSWTSPSQYTDGSSLPAADLAAYRIYSGTTSASLNRLAEVDSLTTSFVAGSLAPGTHYFAVTAVTSSGTESTFSEVGTKTIL